MNKFYAIFSVALLLMGCSKNKITVSSQTDTDEVSAESLITLKSDIETKASAVETAAQMGTVGIYCAYTAEVAWETYYVDTDYSDGYFNRMEDTYLSYNSTSGEWEYNEGEEVMWGFNEISDKYTFFAYSPHSSTNDNIGIDIDVASEMKSGETVSSNIYLGYTTPAAAADQVDLLIAQPRADIHYTSGGYVTLTFDHALSSIDFEAKGDASVAINKIEITGVREKGSAKHTGSAIEWGTYTDTENPVTFVPTLASDILLNETTANPILADDGQLMLIPQTLETGATVTVTYNNTETATFDISQSTVTEWIAGNRYTYTFEITAEDDITFSVKVSEWGTASNDLSASDDGLDYLPTDNYIDLSVYNTYESLTATIEERIADGTTDFTVVGTYFENMFGSGGTSALALPNDASDNPNRDEEIAASEAFWAAYVASPFVNSAITSLDLSAVDMGDETELAGLAFFNYETLSSGGDPLSIESITLPNGITEIGDLAFVFCENLTEVKGLTDVKTVGAVAFCLTNISSIYLPNATSIGDSAFGECYNLTTVDLPLAETLGEGVFSNSGNLEYLNLPSATFLGFDIFYDLHNQKSDKTKMITLILTSEKEIMIPCVDEQTERPCSQYFNLHINSIKAEANYQGGDSYFTNDNIWGWNDGDCYGPYTWNSITLVDTSAE